MLLKQLKARTKNSADSLFRLECRKADRDSLVRFHKIHTARSAHCLIQILQDFAGTNSTQLDACCEIARPHGYTRTVIWENHSVVSEWNTSEGNDPPRVAWRQSFTGGIVDKAIWKELWSTAADALGIIGLLQETQQENLSMPELIDGGTLRVDSQGARVVVTRNGYALKLGLSEIDAVTLETMKANGITAIKRLIGEPSGQSFDMMYRGKEDATTRKLNQLLPICHGVSYILNDNERERFYPAMFKPLERSEEILALPAIELERDNAGQTETVCVVNLVRNSDAWLEFQVKDPFDLLDWFEEALDCKVERWEGPPESRWGWYPGFDP